MSWGKLSDQFWAHPKTRRVLAEKQGLAAIGLHSLAISHAAGFRESAPVPGHVPGWFVESMGKSRSQIDTLISLLLRCELWEYIDGELVIHDFTEYNPLKDELEERRRKDRERKAAQREREREQSKEEAA